MIITHPMDQSVDIGDNVTFTCKASGGRGLFIGLINGGVNIIMNSRSCCGGILNVL